MLTHASRQLPSWLIFDVGQKLSALPAAMYATFRLSTIPSDADGRRKVREVQLCLEEHLLVDEDTPALTPPCTTAGDVEEEFERVIAAIRSKKEEAIALLRNRGRHRKL